MVTYCMPFRGRSVSRPQNSPLLRAFLGRVTLAWSTHKTHVSICHPVITTHFQRKILSIQQAHRMKMDSPEKFNDNTSWQLHAHNHAHSADKNNFFRRRQSACERFRTLSIVADDDVYRFTRRKTATRRISTINKLSPEQPVRWDIDRSPICHHQTGTHHWAPPPALRWTENGRRWSTRNATRPDVFRSLNLLSMGNDSGWTLNMGIVGSWLSS